MSKLRYTIRRRTNGSRYIRTFSGIYNNLDTHPFTVGNRRPRPRRRKKRLYASKNVAAVIRKIEKLYKIVRY